WGLYSILDLLIGLNLDNADPQSNPKDLWGYRALTVIWLPVQGLSLFALIAYLPQAAHLNGLEIAGIIVGLGVVSGAIGINFAHELMHQKNRFERWCADVLLAMALYSHFRSEHLLIHHRYVATPRDPATARLNEGFHTYYRRVLWQCWVSALRAEAAMQRRRGRSAWHLDNPFWRYSALQLGMLGLAWGLGGWLGVLVFIAQAHIAAWQLELVNYIEHYGLTRLHLGDGRYEHVRPHHSWNAAQRASNWLLINLQRHSDHHYKPDRRFPLLQTHPESEAPQLPYGYPTMTLAALVPSLWRRMMNPRVAAWRARHYPGVTDWRPYTRRETPWPR
ncbi:MAG: alkane 1-monooxygenase, partial [Paracoccaceae bacterium]